MISVDTINLFIAISFVLSGIGIVLTVLIDSSGTLTTIIFGNFSKLGFGTALLNLGGFLITLSRK